jgi:phosphomevalonate kinase
MRLQQIATQAHRDFQQGAGSGADIAASVHGGVIQYEMHDQKAVHKNWPAGLYCQLFWSGVPASTTARLARLQAGQRKDSYRRLQDAAVAVAGAWSGPGPGPLLESFSHYVSALQAFDVDHELGIFDAGHDRLVRQAPDHQLVYKPCGAGGGDLGIALGTDPVRLSEFAAVATDNGFVALDLTLDLQGVAFCEDPQ